MPLPRQCGAHVQWSDDDDDRRNQFIPVPSGRRWTWLTDVSAQSHEETLKVGNCHRQRRMTASSKSRWHLLIKMDADARMAVRAKCETVVSTRQASPDGRPPAVVLGQMCADAVTQRSSHLQEAEGGDERAVVVECDAVLRWSNQECKQYGKITAVDGLGEVLSHSVTSVSSGPIHRSTLHVTPVSREGSAVVARSLTAKGDWLDIA